jgi:mono/diheme cytochrome c family protein
MCKIKYAFAFSVIVLLLSAVLASAGGWAVVTLDHLPAQIVANQPVKIGFAVRQHGRTLLNGLNPAIAVSRSDMSQAFTVVAIQQGGEGHYAATLTFPESGAWNWTIDAFGSRQPMPPLIVVESAPANEVAVKPSVPNWGYWVLLVAGILGAVGIAGLALLWVRTRERIALVALVLAGCVAVVTVIFAQSQMTTNAALASAETTRPVQPDLGRSLFLAKGCIVCHQNDRVSIADEGFHQVRVGPNLTNLSIDAEFLRRWLKDPSAVKPGTEMPTLGLSDEEIDALVGFLAASQ